MGKGAAVLAVRVAPGTARLQPTTTFHAQARPAAAITAARGEREGFQVQLAPRRGTVSLRAVVATDPAIAARAYEERPITVRTPSPNGRAGTYFDPLLPVRSRAIRAGSHVTSALWVDVRVPRSTPAGTYRGNVELRVAGAPTVRVPFTVDVGDVQLPLHPHLASSIGLDASQIARFEHPGHGQAARLAMRDRYNRLLASMWLSPGDLDTTGALGADAATYAATPEGAYLQRTLDRSGVRGARVPLYTTFPFDDPLGDNRARAVRYLRNVAAYYRARGWFGDSYVYVIDEPQDADVANVAAYADLVHEADPKLRLLVTHAPSGPFAQLSGVDIWAANISQRVSEADIARTHAQGKQYWWYPGISTFAPYPTLFIDDLRPSPRIMGWLAERYGIDGFLYYSATHWHEVKDPWTEPGTWHNPDGAIGNGDGVLLYPGHDHGERGPVPSIRLLQLRDGIEDDALLHEARRSIGPESVARQVAQVATSLTNFDADPVALEQAHDRLVRSLSGAGAR